VDVETATEPRTCEPAESADNTAPESATPLPRRALKLVVTLRPDDGAGYVVVLALGADGCDPLLRATRAQDLPSALEEVPALLAAAESRWQVAPRYPATTGGSTRSGAPPRARPSTVTPNPVAEKSPPVAGPPSMPATPAPERSDRPGQLPLL
jgi:hypothetical protein